MPAGMSLPAARISTREGAMNNRYFTAYFGDASGDGS